jgi:hypothetical protein
MTYERRVLRVFAGMLLTAAVASVVLSLTPKREPGSILYDEAKAMVARYGR